MQVSDEEVIDLSHAEEPTVGKSTLDRAFKRARDQRVRVRRKGTWYVTKSRSNAAVEYNLLASDDGKVVACDCAGFVNRGWCKHEVWLKARLRRAQRARTR